MSHRTMLRMALSVLVSAFAPMAMIAATAILPVSDDTFLKDGSAANYDNNEQLKLQGDNSHFIEIALLRFDLSSLPSGATIDSAKMYLYCFGESLDDDAIHSVGSDVRVYGVNQQWYESQATWYTSDVSTSWIGGDITQDGNMDLVNDYTVRLINESPNLPAGLSYAANPNYVAGPPPAGDDWPGNYVPFDITALAQEWQSGTRQNYGVALKGYSKVPTDPTETDYYYYGWFQLQFRDSEWSTSTEVPYLEVTYTTYHTITGSIAGADISGVTVKLINADTGAEIDSVTSDASGNFSFTGIAGDTSYIVRPENTGHAFTPHSKLVDVVDSDVTVPAFASSIATTYLITGTVSGAVTDGVLLTMTGASSGVVVTQVGQGGQYLLNGLADGTYTITPTKSGYEFTPASTTVTISGGNQTGINFSSALLSYDVSGTISGLGGVEIDVTLSDGVNTSTVTTSGGAFIFTNVLPGTYTLTPIDTGFDYDPASRSITVVDADFTAQDFTATQSAGDFKFSSATYSIVENGGSITITVQRTGTAGTVTVNYATSDGTASASDYSAASGTLTFAPNVTSQTFTVDVIDDSDVEGDETVTLTLSNPLPSDIAGLTTPSTAVLTIVENDTPAQGLIQFSASNYPIAENGSTATVTIERVGGTSGQISVDYVIATTSTATEGADYTVTASSGTLTFLDGQSQRTLTVTILDDSVVEGNETIVFELSNPTGGAAISGNSSASVTITDDDTAPAGGTVQFSQAVYSVDEAVGTVTVTITRANGDGSTANVTYTVAAGTATATDDYIVSPASAPVSFTGTETTKTFTVQIVNDALSESDETILITLSAASGVAIGSPESATIQINDNDTLSAGGGSSGCAVMTRHATTPSLIWLSILAVILGGSAIRRKA